MQNYDRGMEELQLALECLSYGEGGEDDRLEALYLLGRCLEEQGDEEAAMEQFGTIYGIRREFRDVGERMTRYQFRQLEEV
jgi:hypothetical protein